MFLALGIIGRFI
jgi:MFS family permease